jgi:hypothetical protein
MESLSTSLILLVLALVLLWLAATDKLSRALDAWDVLTGKTTAAASGNVTNTTTVANTTFRLPSLPPLALHNQVSL